MDLEEFSETEIGEALDLLDSSKDDGAAIHLYSRRLNARGGHLLSRPLQPLSNRNQKFTRHLRPSPLEFVSLGVGRQGKIGACPILLQLKPLTRETVLLLNRILIQQLVWCCSKCHFRDGDRYIQGDYCFRRGYLKHNPRLKAAGIRCPTPIFLRLHVLVMEYIGKSGRGAPCLEDANLSEDKMGECYVQMIMVMRNLYQKCNLVHGDLSEYSILYYEGSLHVIDVSQSVDLDHPLASYFLRLDCKHVSDFFRKNGVKVLSTRELFDIIVDSSITDESVHSYLEGSTGNFGLERCDVQADLCGVGHSMGPRHRRFALSFPSSKTVIKAAREIGHG
ncbi:serine/threonine-protein kinase rio1-like [Papaver somniferum]|uniref:serine/threonine-protein kinase rio1-like n=1 Tax=Papaver somniferum TaxID=3469 RepID=UPI000E6FEAE7|nr:serine/threonine-protein kinase rio1-like [Papaver somniferum]